MKPHTNHHDIPSLKQRLLIPEVWQKLGLQGKPAASCRSPFREDKNPSFSISKDGKRWKDYGTGQGGDVIDFIAMARQITTAEALKVFLELAGVPVPVKGRSPQSGAPRGTSFKEKVTALLPPQEPPQREGLRVPLQNGTEADRRLVAETRRITLEAVSTALALRTLTFYIVQGYRCWLLVDAEERRCTLRTSWNAGMCCPWPCWGAARAHGSTPQRWSSCAAAACASIRITMRTAAV
jgi:hypothetical protein